MYLIVNYMRIFSVAKRINKKITIQKADDPNKNTNDQASFLTEAYSFDLPFFWKFTYIPRYIKYFNSFEANPLPLVKSKKYEYNNSSELYKETHYVYYVKKQIMERIERYARSYEERSRQRIVKCAILEHINVLRPYTTLIRTQ